MTDCNTIFFSTTKNGSKCLKLLKIIIASIASVSWTYSANAFDVRGTEFEVAAASYDLDPLLLYSVALAESASGRGDNTISPWPWTLRTMDEAFYAMSREQAVTRLKQLLTFKKRSVDIGFMQVNLFWHGHRVENPVDLLDPITNLKTGAAILSETISSSPGDLELGIGRYHCWKDEARSRSYGKRVLSIYQQVLNL